MHTSVIDLFCIGAEGAQNDDNAGTSKSGTEKECK